MKKTAALLLLVLSSCASTPPGDRTESQKEYEKIEAKNQEESRYYADLLSRKSALDSRIGALDRQILNQQNLIAKWKARSNVASSRAMVKNAEARIANLEKEKADLLDQQGDLLEEIELLQN